MTDNKKKKKQSGIIQAGIGVLTVILVVLILVMMSLVSGIQGTARVVNYAGLVRGKTQRMVKMENAGQPQDGMVQDVQSFIDGLRNGSDELNLVRLDDKSFQNKMEELDDYFQNLKQEVMLVREKGYENTQIIYKSEHFFEICDEATGLAEEYSQKKASSLKRIEKFITADIVVLMLLLGYEFFKALRYAAMNRILQSKVYLDKATGLPNKNKCEELLSVPEPVTEATGIFVFDLNNLRRINNSMGHEMGDEYIRRFAVLLRGAVPEEHFVGRDGGDEFIAIAHDLDHDGMKECLELIRKAAEEYCEQNPELPISYAVGYAISQDYEGCTMRELLAYADKNMYINKNHMKREEAAAEKRLNYQLLKKLKAYGNTFSDCLYCDIRQDTYRLIRASDTFFLAADGSYSGAVEQIVEEQIGRTDKERIWDSLQPSYLKEHLNEKHPSIELQYQHRGDDLGIYGRLTLIFIDEDKDTNLHHFILAFETIQSEEHNTIDAKKQLTQYYEQLKQSILENDSYVDALLQTADAVYCVNLTDDRLEQNFLKKEEQEKSQALIRNLNLPCGYSEYCKKLTAFITADTLEGYRLIDSPAKLLKRYESGEKQVAVEYCETAPEGGLRWIQKTVLMTESLVYDHREEAEKKVVHGMILLKDTTKFHEREKKEHDRLQAAVEEATTANKEKTEFLSRMSHDIRTPINGVMGMLEIIKKNREDHKKVDDCLEKIQISSEHLLALINDVLDMSKLEAGHLEIDHIPFDLNEIMGKIYALTEAQTASTNLCYHAHQGELTHTKLLGSPLHLRQILLNLFSNAVKYNKNGGTIDTYVEEILWADDPSGRKLAGFEFKISDTGIGMSEEFVEKELFEPFTQEKSDARTQYQGTGLGMSIVRELTEKMGGSIQVESAPGKGTTFTVSIPFEINTQAAETQMPKAENTRESIEGIKVLLVEDNDLNMEIAEFFLQEMGARVVRAWNGKEAVDLFAASAPGEFELIMMDIMMPVMDGLEATAAIRAMNRPDAQKVVILAMTANAFSDDVRRSREAGMNEHLSKPLDSEAVKAAILRNI